MDITFSIANTDREFEEGKALFQQYADSLNVDLSFQDFNTELKTIDKQYNKPGGALVLVYLDKLLVACAGIRELDKEIAELKRMFVRPECRGHKIGEKLLNKCIEITQELGYNKIRLDTLPSMTTAQNLYRSFGFYEIPAYRFNPVEGTVYMEKKLTEK
jgi:putative acetyltransferase